MLQIWQFKNRRNQVFANGVILIALVFGFYFIAWQTLRLPDIEDATHTETENIGAFFPAVELPSPKPPKPDIPRPSPPNPQSPPQLAPTPLPPTPEAPAPSSTASTTASSTTPSLASSSTAPPNPYDRTKVAFLVETRPLPHLPALFAHMISVIPAEWTFRFMGGPSALEFMRANPMLSRYEKAGKLEFLDVPANYSLKDRDTISQMFTDHHLYSNILAPAEHLLVFQPDSIFCAGAPTTLNDYLEYDWIGAPWSPTAQFGGNGGLSLRKVSKIVQILEKKKRENTGMPFEDEWLSRELNSLPGAKMATADISKTFSVESVWDETPLGYHIGWMGVHHPQIWDNKDQVDHILKYCPEVKIILGMKLDNDKPQAIQEIAQAEKEEEEKSAASNARPEVPKEKK
ncbi:hypothetical protein GLAREA_02073 [Glarea lozoyensis ATCC 20868]|uniref:DUF5672 domain-containing protein n=1 Tax=Glarea lozoyensis (strain ATCC 20868 / MF5171) TaxID=1116229 RepID=S3D285_GLAL2|nr:uncharacterized protein GLAREA_02073 [Glarea lozoyensis ATCC 20868]EPE26161.1 hypothetical protein GLAREA_02073 [Glarea lozoyensis ATCC 20868]